jgi:adenosylhomocysteine nucleosidase
MRGVFIFIALTSALAASEKILIVGALPQEIAPIEKGLADRSDSIVDGIPCETGELGAHEVVLALTGVGKENAVLATTTLILHYHPAAALMTGTAARIRRTVRTGDIIIASTTVLHDAGSLTSSGIDQTWSDASGHSVAMKWPSPSRTLSDPFNFPGSPEWVAYASGIAARYVPPPVTLDGSSYRPVVRVGVVATGDLSGVSEMKIADIRAKFDPDLMEMESAGFARACEFFHVPHLVIRSGSNLAEEHNIQDYFRLSPIAARQAALFTMELVRSLGSSLPSAAATAPGAGSGAP